MADLVQGKSPMRNFLENLNLPGAHILILMLVGVLAVLAFKWHVPKAEEMVHDAFVALLAILSSKGLSAATAGDK